MKLEARQYARTKLGMIGKIINNSCYIKLGLKKGNYIAIEEDDISKTSFNIIDLIEVGDYVNGLEVDRIIKRNRKIEPSTMIYCKYGNNFIGFYNDEIKSIVTKEQYKNIEYRIGE